MSALDLVRTAGALLGLGEPGAHPAGAVVGVRRDGQSSVATAGVAVAATPGQPEVPMSRGTVLDLASVTKMVSTTALVMRLVTMGRLDLDAPVREHLPVVCGEGREKVTARHLLAHTSGLPPWVPLYCATTTREDALELVARMPLTSAPGARWSYSDLGMVLLGAVLEEVTGLRQDRAFAELVATPLGLRDTGYGPVAPERAAASSDGDVVEFEMVRTGVPYATPFTTDDFHGWRDQPTVGVPNDGNVAHALGGVGGHAGLFAPADELLRLAHWLTDPAAQPAEVRAVFTAPLPVAPDRALGFRLAVLDLGGERVPCVAHPGFTGTFLLSALDRDLSVVVAATRLHTTTGTPRRPRTPTGRLVTVDAITRTGLAGALAALGPGEPGRVRAALPSEPTTRTRSTP